MGRVLQRLFYLIYKAKMCFSNIGAALGSDTQLRLFGKPEIAGTRRLGVALAIADSIENALDMAKKTANTVCVSG